MRKKLLKKDYNEELEEIAESKRFDKEAQNLLLSMVYKVEGAYDDYKTVKREVLTKEEFLQNIINIVNMHLKEIKIAKPNSLLEKELKVSKCKIIQTDDDNERKVIFFPNEKVVLYSIIKAGLDKIDENLSLEYKAILATIQIGKCISYSEVIRDFNGFSWSILTNEIESIICNIIYTDLIYLLGEKFVSSINSSNIKNLKNNINDKLYKQIQKQALNFYLSYDEEQKEYINNKLKEDKEKLKQMQNQKLFIENISKNKKEMFNRIKQIDEMLNNPDLLRKEYVEKNKKLENDKKIFSINHYKEMLQKEREKLIEKINKNNKFQNPIEYVKIKKELEEKIEYYESIDNAYFDIIEMQNNFLSEFESKINNINNKDEMLNYLYKIRYLKFLPINKKQNMKDIVNFEKLEKKAIKKGIELNLITPISNNNDTDYLLLKSIFETKSINIDNFSIRLIVEKSKLKSEIYDGDILDSTNYVNLKEGSNVHLRKTKKVKIFN